MPYNNDIVKHVMIIIIIIIIWYDVTRRGSCGGLGVESVRDVERKRGEIKTTHTCLDGKTAVGLIECWCAQRYSEYRRVTATRPGPLVQQDNGPSDRPVGHPVQTSSTVVVSSSGRLSGRHRTRRHEHMSARRRRHGAEKRMSSASWAGCCTVDKTGDQ